ncbi:unnamed protein product [Chrysoparadoxa australica]
MPTKLNGSNLAKLKDDIVKPKYDRPVEGGIFTDKYICHIGIGSFHRSHQAVYTDDVLNLGVDPSWGIVGIGLTKSKTGLQKHAEMKDQDCLYTVMTLSPEVQETRIVGSIIDYLLAPEDYPGTIDKLADPKCAIVSLTVTEKGYMQDVNGDLDTDNSRVKDDLANDLATPKTCTGIILAALRKRMQAGVPSFTVMSCDNLPENGDKIKHVTLQMAKLVSQELHDWVKENTTFPNTMVDRITPATEPHHREKLEKENDLMDGSPVIAEDFKQWVIEDSFACGRPAWDKVGALVVKDVKPYEFMKLRLLNGGHSALSYISVLAGHTFVDEAMDDSLITSFVKGYFSEMKKTLLPVEGVDTEAYMDKLIERFSNPYVKDKCTRLAEDGSKKMQNTMRDGAVELVREGLPITFIALANAAWIRYMTGEDEQGKPTLINDPAGEELTALAKIAVQDPINPAPEKFLESVHGVELANLSTFVDTVKAHLVSLLSVGAKETLKVVLPCFHTSQLGSYSFALSTLESISYTYLYQYWMPDD